jgi:trans-aconitate methyltransferase
MPRSPGRLRPTDPAGAVVVWFGRAGDLGPPGTWTKELRDLAGALVALDASAEMLLINRQKLGDHANVRYIQADFFSWTPDKKYDLVFFSHWLSRIPAPLFEEFWDHVGACLKPSGHMFAVDELPSEIWHEQFINEEEQIAVN